MTISKRLLALLLALAMCFALGACGSSNTTTSETPSDAVESESADPDSSESPAIEVDLSQPMYEFCSGLSNEDTAITVNGVAVPYEMFFYWLSYDCYYMDYYYYQYGSYADFTDESLRDYILEDTQMAVTYYATLRQMCDELGITITADQEAEYLAMLDEAITSSYGGDEDLLLQVFGLSRESLDYLYHNDYLYENYAAAVFGEPTEADLQQYVDDHGVFGVKHILLMTTTEDVTDDDGNVTQTADEYNAAQKALAEDLVAQLQSAEDRDTLFDELMNQYSEDSGLSSYPDGYTFTNDDSLVDGFREATLELEEGGMSGVVETDYGYHILLRLPVDTSSFRDSWLSEQMTTLFTEKVEAADVVVSEALTDFDVATFYERYSAYYNELYAKVLAVTSTESES